MSGTTPRCVTPEMVRGVWDNPPEFIAKSHLPAWRAGRRFSTEAFAGGVVAALERSPYSVGDVDAVLEILRGMGYGAEPISAVWA